MVGEQATKKEWLDSLRVGDTVLYGANDNPRVIRHVDRDKRGFVTYVAFAILHCSWTGRAHTIYDRHTIKTLCKPSGLPTFKALKKTSGQKLFEKNLNQHCTEPITLDCCDVKGWP